MSDAGALPAAASKAGIPQPPLGLDLVLNRVLPRAPLPEPSGSLLGGPRGCLVVLLVLVVAVGMCPAFLYTR